MPRPSKQDGVLYPRKDGKILWMVYRDRNGRRIRESTSTEDWQEAHRKLRERLQALKQGFAGRSIGDITAGDIEHYLRRRLQARVQFRTANGVVQKDLLKPATVHQELRVLRRMLNVAVRKKLLPSNPCAGVEFPVKVKGLFRPHYMGWSEQERIEFHAPEYLRNIIRIITETGLRVYKELLSMKTDQVDLENAVVWIPIQRRPTGLQKYHSRSWQLKHFVNSSDWLVSVPGCFPVPRIRRAIRRR